MLFVMNWILVAFLEPILFALTNVLDSNLTNRLFKNAWILTVLVAVSNLLFIPIIWLLDPPQLINLNLVPYVVLVSFIELYYAYPYYKALQNDDTSVIISLFSLGKVFVPVLAFFLIGEILKPIQYFGFAIVVLSSVAITFNRKEKFKLNKSFFYMFLSSSLLAVEVVVYKYVFEQISWGAGLFWTIVISALMGLASLLVGKFRVGFREEFQALKKYYPYILTVGGLGFFGFIGFSYAIAQVPATVSRSISSFQPFFVLLYAVLFSRFLPRAFKENVSSSILIKKLLLFIFTTVGVVLIVN